MSIKELFKKLKTRRAERKNYKIESYCQLVMDTEDYCLAFIPTIIWQPWVCRESNIRGVVDIWWLNVHLLIGKWTLKKKG